MSDKQICIYCKQEKLLSEFPSHSRYKLGVDDRCRECINKNTSLVRQLRKKAPLPPEKCECCGKMPKIDSRTGKTQTLRLDHNHDTQQFRGWLCDRCNSGIGKLGDNIEGIVNALNYLLSRK